MALLTVLVVVLMLSVVGAVVGRMLAAAPLMPDGDEIDADPGPDCGRDPDGAETVLVGQLMAGDLSRAEYHDAMAGLAAWDARSYPMGVPWHWEA